MKKASTSGFEMLMVVFTIIGLVT
ncbi:TPA: hypothetical protein ACU17C_002759 [Staphylococcus aureus]